MKITMKTTITETYIESNERELKESRPLADNLYGLLNRIAMAQDPQGEGERDEEEDDDAEGATNGADNDLR